MKGARPNYYSGFDPKLIPGCALWLDAADRDTLTLSGNNVTQWNDKSGNGRNAIGNTGTGTYSSNGLNSRPTVQITPTGNMQSPIPAGTFPSGFAIFVVYQKTGANGSFDTVVARTTAGYPSPFDLFHSDALGQRRIVGSNSTSYREMSNAVSIARRTTPTVLSINVISATPSNWTETLDGTRADYAVTGFVTGGGVYGDLGTSLHLGTRDNGITTMTGNISEVIMYSTSSLFTVQQRQQVEGYLARKWGLSSNLPTSHPYRSLPVTRRQLIPTDIPNCALWLDAADLGSIASSNGVVTLWRDKSGNERNATTGAGTGVVTGGTTLNGLNTLNFATGSYLLTPSFTMDTITRTAFVVYKFTSNVYPTDANFYDVLFLYGNTAATNAFIFQIGRANASPYGWFGRFTINGVGGFPTPSNTFFDGAAGPTNQPFLLTVQRSATQTGLIRSSGINLGTSFAGTNAFQATEALRVGERMSNTQIAELIYYNAALPIEQIMQVEGYLARKWGLQSNLPPVISTPLSISNCVLWLDGTSGVSGNVWSDKSTTSNNATRTEGTITTTTVSGRQALSLSSVIMTYSNSLIFNGTTGSSCFFVFSAPSNANGHLLRSVLGGLNNHLLWTDQNLYENIGFSSRQSISGFSHNTLQLYTNIANRSGTTFVFRNGNRISSIAYGSGYTGLTYSLGGASGAISWTGTVCDIIVYSRTLSLAEQQRVEDYLTRKWAIQSAAPLNPYTVGLPALAAGFTPLAISNCALWLDAADQSTITTSGGAVTQWNDKSGNARNATTGAGTGVVSGSTTLNGLNTLNFASASYLLTPSFTMNTLTRTAFIVYRFTSNLYPSNSSYYDLYFLYGNTATTNAFQFKITRNNAQPYQWIGSFGITNVGSFPDTFPTGFVSNAAGPTNQPFLLTIQRSAAQTGLVRSNGSNITPIVFTRTNAFLATEALRVGQNMSNTQIAEILYYNAALSSNEITQVEGYLAWKWGLTQSLPSVGAASGFTPTSISGCQLWLDAADATTFTFSSGSNIATWIDKSPNAYIGTAFGTPLLTTDGGFSAVNFANLVTQYFNFGDAADIGSNPLYLFVVARFSSTAAGSLVAKSVAGDAVQRYALLRDAGTLTPLIQGNTIGTVNNAGVADTNTTRRVLTMVWDRSRITLFQNGIISFTSAFADTVSFNTTYTLLVGAYNNASGGAHFGASLLFKGFIHEIVIMAASLTTFQREQIEAYLAGKWGLQASFPTTHPYRDTRP